jgi:hypothetical protein
VFSLLSSKQPGATPACADIDERKIKDGDKPCFNKLKKNNLGDAQAQ